VRDLFLENSAGQFTIEDAGLLGWYQSEKLWEHYWNESCATDPNDADGDGWLDGHVEKRTEAILKADADFNFDAFDLDDDGVLSPDELGILIVFPATGASGFNRAVVGRQYPPSNGQCPFVSEDAPHDPLVVDGVRMTVAAEIYAGTGPSFSVPAHELSHLLLDGMDMYGFCIENFTICGHSSAPGIYSLMDESHSGTHMDPFHKLKYGWVHPLIIFRDGTYNLRSVQNSHDVWILMDPERSTDEYFIIENRWRDPDSYDAPLPDDGGLAVWHVMEDPADYTTAVRPPLTDPDMWAALQGDPGRRAVQLIRPVWSLPINDALALWDAAQAGADHDLLSVDPDPTHGTLLWADGTPSGFTVRDISAAGPVMTARITVP
jgi:M6 family metalloprotease-like protein